MQFKSLTFFGILLIGWIQLSGQGDSDSKFRGMAILGANASQITGDDLAGYNKLGLNAGFGVHFMFTEKISTSITLLYSQKGSKSQLNQNNAGNQRKILLDYVEIPVLFNFFDRERAIFSAGPSLGRLVRYKEFDSNGQLNTLENTPYGDWDISAVASVSFLFKVRYGVNLRFAHSLASLGTFTESNLKNQGQYHNSVSIRLLYLL